MIYSLMGSVRSFDGGGGGGGGGGGTTSLSYFEKVCNYPTRATCIAAGASALKNVEQFRF